jgi:Na+-transporting methylmalonyl-CoA/oxaloacetate decarboxylase gamma subunit
MIYDGSIVVSKIVMNIFILGIGLFFMILSVFVILCLIQVIGEEIKRAYGRSNNN